MIEISNYDMQVYNEIRDFLPERIIDCHTHVFLNEHFLSREVTRGQEWAYRVAAQCSIEELISFYKAFFPDKEVIPVVFGFPINTDYVQNNAYVRQESEKRNYPRLYNVHPDMAPDELVEAFNCGAVGIKPYLSNAPGYLPENEIRIFDFLTHEHLAVCNRHKAAVMLHIPRSGRLRDPVNIAQILEIEQKYPDAQIILAHIGRAYAPDDIGDAFKQLAKTQSVMFDFSANTFDTAIKAALDTVGAKRVLFGTDLPIAIMRMRRIVEAGSYINIIPPGLYGDINGVAHMREASPGEPISFFIYEIIRAAMRAMSGASRQDIDDVFYHNAKRIFRWKEV